MTVPFDPALVNPRDRIRQRLGETAPSSRIADETIAAYLAQGKTELQAAAQLARDLSAYWAGQASEVTVDRQTINTAARAKTYTDLANKLEAEASSAAPAQVGPYPGVIVTGLYDRPFGVCADDFFALPRPPGFLYD